MTQVDSRERALVETFARLADSLVDDFDITELLTGLCESATSLFDVRACGLLLRGRDGALSLAACSGEQARLLELLQLRTDEGACVQAADTGEPVLVDDLHDWQERWPRWAPAAVGAGYRSVTSIPLRLRDQVLGAMNLFDTEPGSLTGDDLYAARAMTQVATTALLAHRQLRDSTALTQQLQTALDSRVVIEQAKGVVAQRDGTSLEDAFDQLRRQARSERRQLSALAQDVVSSTAIG